MLADRAGGNDPTHRRQGSVLRRGVVAVDGGDVALLAVRAHGVEVGQRVPDAGRLGVLLDRRAGQGRVVLAVGFGAGHDVVAPGHAVLVHQVGQVGPGVDRPAAWPGAGRYGRVRQAGVLRPARILQGVRTAGRVMGGAGGGPFRDLKQVLGEAPGGVRLEHVVLQHVVRGVGPVVRNVALRVIAQY